MSDRKEKKYFCCSEEIQPIYISDQFNCCQDVVHSGANQRDDGRDDKEGGGVRGDPQGDGQREHGGDGQQPEGGLGGDDREGGRVPGVHVPCEPPCVRGHGGYGQQPGGALGW